MILGLTGAIGCGKSTACGHFVKHGWQLFDADKVCHLLYADSRSPLAQAIVKEWGEECFSSQGTIDRKVLAEKVFSSKTELEKLTSMIYPALFQRMEESIAAARKADRHLLCEVPLLFECDTVRYFDKTAVVWCTDALRRERLKKFRFFTDEEITQREARQWPSHKKLEAADIAFINNGGAEFLYRQIDEFIKEL